MNKMKTIEDKKHRKIVMCSLTEMNRCCMYATTDFNYKIIHRE